MSRAPRLVAALALVPAMCGPAIARAATVEIALCGGGAVSIPLRDMPPPPATEPCCAKGCHSQRKRAEQGGDD